MKQTLFILLLLPIYARTQIITTLAGCDIVGFSGDGGAATAAKLHSPWGVAVDNSGNIYIADAFNNRVRKVSPTGTISTIAGGGTIIGSGGRPATAQYLAFPYGVAVDGIGNVYIADDGLSRVYKVDTLGIINCIAGTGMNGFSGDGGPATNAMLNNSVAVAIDNNGNIFIADQDNHRIRKINSTGIITTIVGNGSIGYSGDGMLATNSRLNYPSGVAVDSIGNIYVADEANNRIRKIDTFGIISTFAGTGITGYTGDGGPAVNAKLAQAYGVCTNNGNIYIADWMNNVIRKVDTAGIITTIVGNGYGHGTGIGGYSGDGGPATSAELTLPYGVIFDPCNNLYIADGANNCVRSYYSGWN